VAFKVISLLQAFFKCDFAYSMVLQQLTWHCLRIR